MNKKGFTLTELIAILVIISIVALIAVPAVVNSIKNNNHDSYNGVVNDIILASETYAANMGASIVQVSVETLKQAGYLPADLKNPIDNTNFNGCVYVVNGDPIYKEETCSTIILNVDGIRLYKDSVLNGLDPVLDTGLIPVTIADDETDKKASLGSEWYNYAQKKWANAVILKDSDNYREGEIIPENAIESYFVWIPKFKYKLFDMGNYSSTSTTEPASSIAQTIDIVFDPINTIDSSTSCVTPLTSGASGNCAVGKYMTHPAFITMNVNGLWVGKFETGYDGAATRNEAQVNSNDSSKVIVKPNVYSWRGFDVSNAFTASYNYQRNLDSHMMKNTEWGATAYLSLSNYGINTEVRINNNKQFQTGCAATVAATTNVDVSQSDHSEGYYNGCENAYNTAIGYLASTTGNITGVYDMSGGANEYMAAYSSNDMSALILNPNNYDSKYFDVYNANSSVNSYNYRILGDATGEAGPFYKYEDSDGTSRYHNNWYADYSYFLEPTKLWFVRGGNYTSGLTTGQFFFNRRDGYAVSSYGYRVVLAPQSDEPIAQPQVVHVNSIGTEWTFDYTGAIQTFTAEDSGIYKLEVWGAQGGNVTGGSNRGGLGGYSQGEIPLAAHETIYIGVGGAGGTPAAGWNGGGTGILTGSLTHGGGGGATHIGKTNNVLKDTLSTNVFLVAGGGGGGGNQSDNRLLGGYGGGTSGGNGGGTSGGAGGTQTTGAAYGAGASSPTNNGAAGGGGWYGGGYGGNYNGGNAGGGGSGYIGGVTDGETIAGNASMPTHDGTSTMTGNSGHGYAKITLLSY